MLKIEIGTCISRTCCLPTDVVLKSLLESRRSFLCMARIPTESALTQSRSRYAVDTDDFKLDLISSLSLAWKLAGENIKSSQASQKRFYDRSTQKPKLQPGDRVMVYMPAEQQGKAWKLSRPLHGLFSVLSVTDTIVEVRYPEQGDTVWSG